jgi:hypothetical protein
VTSAEQHRTAGGSRPADGATDRGSGRVDLSVVVLVEGRSDVAAVTALLATAGIASSGRIRLVDMGGVTNIRRHLEVFTDPDRARRVLGMCDADEERVVARALGGAGVPVGGREAMSRYGFHVCDADLEDELIRTVGPEKVSDILTGLGLARRFDRFTRQLAWRDADLHSRLHRFAGIASGRKVQMARAMAAAIPWVDLRPPLRDLVVQISAALSDDESLPLQPFSDRDRLHGLHLPYQDAGTSP